MSPEQDNSFDRQLRKAMGGVAIYRQFSDGAWNYWTEIEGQKVALTKAQYGNAESHGAKAVLVP
jgi:hypothetical protein